MMIYLPSIERARQYLLWIGRNEFFKKSTIKFLTPRHLPSRSNISTTVAENHMRSKHMETRHPELSRETNFEEIQAAEDLQTV